MDGVSVAVKLPTNTCVGLAVLGPASEMENRHTYVHRIIENMPKIIRAIHLILIQVVRRFSL